MHHQLSIIKYIFNRENVNITFDSIDSFFNDGISFPKLISIIYTNNVPDIIENPANSKEKEENIDNTIYFLFNCQKKLMRRPSGREYSWIRLEYDTGYFSHRERKNLLSALFKNMCFPMSPEEVLIKSNKILKSINIQFKNSKDIINGYFITLLLHVLTDGEVKIIKNFDKNKFEKILQETFSIAKVPLIIDKKDMSKLKADYFFIQIQIIFEVYSEKIEKLINDKFYMFEYVEDEALLKTVSEISKNISNVVNYDDLYKNNFIPKFVLNYFNINSIENVCIENSIGNDHKFTENEINNIKATVIYLSSLNDDFKILTLDFENPSNCEYSSKLFFRTFCNVFFIKSPRRKMIERCRILLLNKKNWTTENLFSEFSKFDTFLYLAHFCMLGDLNLNLKKEDLTDDFAFKLFKRSNVPLIVNQKILSYFDYEDALPDSLFYQLQFIFDIIDSFHGSQKVVECFLISMKKIQEVKVQPFETFLTKIRSQFVNHTLENSYKTIEKEEIKNEKLKSEQKESDIKSEQNENDIKYEQNESDIKSEPNENDAKQREQISKEKFESTDDDDIFLEKYQGEVDKYWNDYHKYFHLSQGILYNDQENFSSDEIYNYDQKIAEVLEKVEEKEKEAKKASIKKNKKIKSKNKNKEILKQQSKPQKGPETQPDFETVLYKIIYYDESNDKWVFDNEVFEQFAEASNLKSESIKCPLISYLPSEENDLLQINSLFIKGTYPSLGPEEEEEEDIDEQIYVYPFCDKTLAEIYNDMHLPYTSEQEKIKPIFLLVHTPKKKEKLFRIDTIMLRLYIFLSLISDIKVVSIHDKNTYLHQSSSVVIISAVSNSVGSLGSSYGTFHENEYLSLINYLKEYENKSHLDCVYSNGKHLKIKEHKLLYLFNKRDLENKEDYYNDEYQEDLNRILTHEQNAIISLFDILNFETYKNYIDVINDVSSKSSSYYSELKNNFQCIEASDICNRFFRMIYRQVVNRLHEDVALAIDHFDFLYEEIYKNESEMAHFDRIQKNLDDHIPQYCQFMRILSKIMIDDKRYNKKDDSNAISNMLENTKKKFMEKVKEQFNRKQIWTETEIENVTDRLNCLLREEFFNATKKLATNDEDHIDMYQYHLKDLEFALSNSNNDIKNLFMECFNQMETKSSVIPTKFDDATNQAANYIVKETENIKEITVEVDINSDLKTIIQQDF